MRGEGAYQGKKKGHVLTDMWETLILKAMK